MEWKENKLTRQKQCGALLLVVIGLEIVLNLINFGVNFPGTTTAFYPRGKEYTASMIRYMHEREWDELFFRAETTHSQTLNDGALNNYHGVSTFTSSANVSVTEFMSKLGYGAKDTYNRYCYEEASPVANLFLGLKYMIERSGAVEENPYFNDLHSYGDVHLLENNAYLPLGFLAEDALAELSFSGNENVFDFQNDLFATATGLEEPIWYHMYGNVLSITSDQAELTKTTPGGYCTYNAGSEGGRINYEYTATMDGFMCIYLDLSERNNFTLWLNGDELYSETYSIPQMLSVCQVHVGDVVDVALSCEAYESGSISISAALMEDNAFWAGYNKLSQSTLKVTDFSTTKVDGTILCNRDGLLYTSIPQDGNWHVYVDGQETPSVLVGDTMVAVHLTQGSHEVSFRYHNKAFAFGWKISVLCTAIMAGLYLWIYPARNKKGKYSR